MKKIKEIFRVLPVYQEISKARKLNALKLIIVWVGMEIAKLENYKNK